VVVTSGKQINAGLQRTDADELNKVGGSRFSLRNGKSFRDGPFAKSVQAFKEIKIEIKKPLSG